MIRYTLIKTLADRILALFLFLILLPVFLVVSISLLLKMGSPVIFVQQRPGYMGRPLNLLKFRTMTNKRDEYGDLLPDSERLTAFGRWLRATSIDELPGVINVLRGDLSFIGPRPLLTQYLPLYSAYQARRHDVKPGFSGWAQINGRNAITWEQRFCYDVWYVDNQSIWLDLRILLITIWKVICREGINSPGEATMTEFKGTPL